MSFFSKIYFHRLRFNVKKEATTYIYNCIAQQKLLIEILRKNVNKNGFQQKVKLNL